MESVELIERAMVAIRRRQRRRALAPADEPAGQAFDVLDLVASDPAATVSTVSEGLSVDRPRASRLVAAAVDAGLVERVADQGDGRRALLRVTEQGRAAVHAAQRRRRDVFASAMGDWTDAERAQFATLLTRFVEGLPEPAQERGREG